MAELERIKIIPLAVSIEDTAQKIVYEQLELKAPVLAQVEQFYEVQSKGTAIAAMRLLISLVSSVPESILKKMDYVDFLECQEYLLGFLTWKPSEIGKP
ncbi:phage tail assembly protein [Pectobacterium polaris]|uniref:phage tail assembly protein n=1 Tax=Pectobacterium polaris TaxID=2042057 RepID=UPI000D607105|nr:phage tail assembly protein [Pectobacterium polaris]MCU1787757.1 phage tail assembly protein [Pectobacterium polaris]PWD57071.1 phage tail assembly protein [Pectobacterium polaris]